MTLLFGESGTPGGVVVQSKLYLQQIKKSQGIAFKASKESEWVPFV